MADTVVKTEAKKEPKKLDFTSPTKEWTRAMKADYQNQVREAYNDAVDKFDLDSTSDDLKTRETTSQTCTNASGSVLSKCRCRHCCGARAAYAKQSELTGYIAEVEE